MNSNLHLLQSNAQIESTLRRAQTRHPAALGNRDSGAKVVIRLASDADGPALERLSQLEGRSLEPGARLIAARGGVILAAVSIGGGDAIADSFRPTADLVDLLLRSRAHLRGEGRRPRRRPLARLRRLLSPRYAGAGAPTAPGNEHLLIR
jgi:hypothetical protein